MVTRIAPFGLAAVLSASLASGDGPTAAASPEPARGLRIDRFQWSRDVGGDAPISAVEIRNDYGDIRARSTADRRLEASAVIQRLDPGSYGVGVTVERRGGVVALTAAYPSGRVQDAEPEPPKDSLDRLDLTVFLPEGVALGAQTLRGMVEARGLKSDVTAVSLAGAIFVSTTGAVQARSASGEITAVVGAGSSSRPLLLETDTGPISLTLPAAVDVDVRARTSGPLSTEFPLRSRPSGPGTRADGKLGRGGRELLVWSRLGRIEILRAP